MTAGALPAGLTLSGAGAITGTPTQTVSATFTVRASDGSRAATKQFTLHVVEPLVVTAPPAKAIKFGRSFLLTLTARGGLAPYKWSSPSLPPGINVNPTTGQVGGRPAGLGTLTLTLIGHGRARGVAERHGDRRGGRTTLDRDDEPAGRTERKAVRRLLKTSGGSTLVSLKLVGPLPPGLTFDASTGVLSGVPTLPARKPLVKTKRVKTKNGTKLVKKLVARAPLARTYTLYFVATDSLGQRDSQKLRLTVRP